MTDEEADMANDNGSAGTVLMAFILGAISGAAVALLYAPTSGRETRDYLGDKAREGRARAYEAAERGRQAVSEAIERGQEAFRQARSDRAGDNA